MSETKKYYWLKLHKNFFKRHEIKIIEGMENGKDYVLFYLKLLSESVSHGGKLRFSDEIPYDAQMLSSITNTDLNVVKTAMNVFTQLNLMEIQEDETICMTEVGDMIGSETVWAEKKRRQRNKRDNVSDMSSEDREAELPNTPENSEKSKEPRARIKKVPYQFIIDQYNSICTRLPKVRTLSEARKRMIKGRFNQYGEEAIVDVFVKANLSDFLCGEKGWNANFDWLMKDSNFAKVLDGNYENHNNSGVTESQKTDVDQKNEELLKDYFD